MLLRLWLLRAAGPIPARGAVGASVLLGVGSLALWVAIDWWQSQPDPRLSAAAIPLFAWYGLALFGLASLVRRQTRVQTADAPLLTLLMGLLPVLMLFVTIATMWVDPRWLSAARALIAVYTLIYLRRSLRALSGEPQRLAALLGLAYVGAFLWATDRLDVIPDIWNPAEADSASSAAPEADQDAGTDAEAILFSQVPQIDAALAPIRRGAGEAPEVFFLGFAGVGEERVFAGEIGLAERVIGSRYRLDQRHVELVNDQRDFEHRPLATVSGLRYALHGIAARMRLDRDILFLSISSHGSSDGAIAVSNGRLPLDDLTPADLVEALQDAGIEWRVIIVSACYAGVFIPALQSPRSIVLTAAAADRTSFGCSNDRDLTYFGEAFYRDALPRARSLEGAFAAAKAAIDARERREGFTPSNPQAYFGSAITPRLATLAGAAALPPP